MILPPATLGMLGGGQLGRFFVAAAHEMGYRVWVLDPDRNSPAAGLAERHFCVAYDDYAALDEFAENGFAGTSVRKLARDLGVSHNLIPQRFGSKERLWYAAVDQGFGALATDLFANLDATELRPDGSRVAMVLSGEGNPEVYVGNAQGRQIRRLTNTPAVEASPTWSPDGSRILYVSDSAGGPQLYVMPATGGSPTRLATNISGYCAEPDWSDANPNKIVFTAKMGGGYQTGVFDLAARASKIVTKAPTDAIEPVWMGDGRHVMCTYRAANTRSLWLVDTESGKATRLSPTSLGNASGAAYLAP